MQMSQEDSPDTVVTPLADMAPPSAGLPEWSDRSVNPSVDPDKADVHYFVPKDIMAEFDKLARQR